MKSHKGTKGGWVQELPKPGGGRSCQASGVWWREESRTLAAKLSLAARGWPKEALIPKGPGFWK